MILTHSLWLIKLDEDKPIITTKSRESVIEAGHQVLKIPATIFTVSADNYRSKTPITILYKNKTLVRKAYLRKVIRSELVSSGTIAIIEVPVESISLLKRYDDELIQIYPEITKEEPPLNRSLSPYEVNI